MHIRLVTRKESEMSKFYEEPEMEVVRLEESFKVACYASSDIQDGDKEPGWGDI